MKDDIDSDNFLFFAVSHETRFFVMNISLYRQFFITGFFSVMKNSHMEKLFMIINRNRLAFVMKNSCIGVRGKINLPPHGKVFLHATVSSFLHLPVRTFYMTR